MGVAATGIEEGGGRVRVFVTREKRHRWMGARLADHIASILMIRVKMVPRVSLVGCLVLESQKIGLKFLIYFKT